VRFTGTRRALCPENGYSTVVESSPASPTILERSQAGWTVPRIRIPHGGGGRSAEGLVARENFGRGFYSTACYEQGGE